MTPAYDLRLRSIIRFSLHWRHRRQKDSVMRYTLSTHANNEHFIFEGKNDIARFVSLGLANRVLHYLNGEDVPETSPVPEKPSGALGTLNQEVVRLKHRCKLIDESLDRHDNDIGKVVNFQTGTQIALEEHRGEIERLKSEVSKFLTLLSNQVVICDELQKQINVSRGPAILIQEEDADCRMMQDPGTDSELEEDADPQYVLEGLKKFLKKESRNRGHVSIKSVLETIEELEK
jgi:hypothetical protein